jgi:hypothetical protein
VKLEVQRTISSINHNPAVPRNKSANQIRQKRATYTVDDCIKTFVVCDFLDPFREIPPSSREFNDFESAVPATSLEDFRFQLKTGSCQFIA